VLAQVGWDVERDGLVGAPRVRLVVGEERHATVDRAARLLGLGTAAVEPVPARADGTIDIDALDRVLAGGPTGAGPAGSGPAGSGPARSGRAGSRPVAPAIVCVQAGNVNTGAFDDLVAARSVTDRHGAWLHVDGAFGLWAAASPSHRHLVRGIEAADSWACDGHKWLNVPFDSGFTFCAHPDSHVAAMSYTAAYLVGQGDGAALRAPSDFVPESSRRARGFATWAALQELGRDGVAELVERCARLARRFAAALAAGGVEVVNDVVLNQVLVGFGDDARTDRVIAAVQDEGTCWFGATTWHGRRLARISVSNWSTTQEDIDRSAAAVLAAAASVPTA
jgi:glutamate/tyrosine decarboxylase-like PLP-dependent enzyme